MASMTCMKLKLGVQICLRQSTPSLIITAFCMMPGEHFKAGYTMKGSTWGCHTWHVYVVTSTLH